MSDRRTDGRTLHDSKDRAYAYASRGKKAGPDNDGPNRRSKKSGPDNDGPNDVTFGMENYNGLTTRR